MKNFDHNRYNPNLKEYARELRTETVSRAEKALWKIVLSRRQMNVRFLRQRSIDRFIVDFFCPELGLIVEIDGNSHFHNPEYDSYREDRLKSFGYEIIRFSEGNVLNNIDEVHQQLEHSIYCLKLSGK